LIDNTTQEKALRLIDQAKEESWEILDLSGMNLTELPPEIQKLGKLKSLILGKWDSDQAKIGLSSILSNPLNQLPDEIADLACLETLSLCATKVISGKETT